MKHVKQLLSALLVLAVVLSLLPAGVLKASAAEAPAALDIGYPTFKNTELLDEVYDLSKLGVSYSEKDIMMAIYKQDLANGGDSFYMDRILAREGVCNGNAGSNGNADGNTFLTRGRALYMYTSSPSVIGFGGNTAYHQPLGRGDLVRVLFSNADGSLTTKEDTSKRVNAPSNWSSTYSVGSNLTLDVVKFIHQENVAVTTMTLTNKSAEDQAITVAADSIFATEPGKVTVNGAEQTELTGTCSSPAGLTTIYARMTGDGFEAASSDDYCWLSRDVTVPAGGSVELKVVIALRRKRSRSPPSSTSASQASETLRLSVRRRRNTTSTGRRTCPTSTCRRRPSRRRSIIAGGWSASTRSMPTSPAMTISTPSPSRASSATTTRLS